MTLRISYFVPPAPLVAAREAGLLDDVDLRETRTSGSPEQHAGLLAGHLDLVVTAIDNLFAWTEEGADVRIVAQVEPTTPLAIVAGSGIRTLEELKGRSFAVDAPTNGFALVARHLLGRSGIDMEFVQIGGVKERFDALTSGRVDATLLGPPFVTAAVDTGLRELLRVEDEIPAFPGQGLVIRRVLLGSPEVEAFLTALRAAGALPVDSAGLDVLTDIRESLGMLPQGVSLHELVAI